MEPYSIAARLVGLAAEARQHAAEDFWTKGGEIEAPLNRGSIVWEGYSSRAKQMSDELEAALVETDWHPSSHEIVRVSQSDWTFGMLTNLSVSPRKILRGYIQPVESRPLLSKVSLKVVCFLMTVESGKDYLLRESGGGIGWHYHYLDWKERRSDVVVCWDTRWAVVSVKGLPNATRGLFVEKHAVKRKEFKAKPDSWGLEKRETIYRVCFEDLTKRDISQYRCASDNSEAVYPLGATLTPRPVSVPAAKRKVK